MTDARHLVDSWPVHRHLCAATGGLVDLRFRGGAAVSGAAVTCAHCGVVFEYRKPLPSARIIPGQGDGPRTYF